MPFPHPFRMARVSSGSLVYRRWIFIYLFFYLSSPNNYNLALLVVCISTSIFILLISFFFSWPFCRNFICIQFHLLIPIYQILYYLIWSSFFGFLIFYLDFLVKVLLVFNLIFQFKLIVLYVLIWSLFFLLLILFLSPFVRFIILFDFTL